MRHRASLVLAPVLAAVTLLAPSAAHAQEEQGPLCNGTPANQSTYFCIVHFHPEDAIPDITVEPGGLVIPSVCVVNPVCTPRMEMDEFGVEPQRAELLTVYWNFTCITVYSDGTVDERPGGLNTSVHPPMPVCD